MIDGIVILGGFWVPKFTHRYFYGIVNSSKFVSVYDSEERQCNEIIKIPCLEITHSRS